MTGSLLQIVSTDIKDIFLTIDPQITFFKIVYLRHTPFAIDLLEETFNTIPNFSEDGFCSLSKNGDLVSKIFVKIELPSIKISNVVDQEMLERYNNNNIKLYDNDDKVDNHIKLYAENMKNFNKFTSVSMIYWRELYVLSNNITSNYTTIINYIDGKNNSQDDNQNIYSTYKNIFRDTNISNINFNFNFDILNYIQNNFTEYKNSIYNTTLNNEFKTKLLKYLSDYLFFQKLYLKFLIDTSKYLFNIKEKELSSFYNFSWVSKIGFALIDYITIEIGGQEVDRITSDILNNWYELAMTQEKNDIINKMIGNIDILTNYDNNLKPSYTLLVPLPFWFCKYKSQALPCVSLKHNDILIRVKFNDLNKCCFFEPEENNKYVSNININEVIKIQNISLLVEYVHLGEDERKKFGSFKNEILIEQHKEIIYNYVIDNKPLLLLDFVNPIKELIWTIQKTSHVNNLKLWNNFETNCVFRVYITESNNNAIQITLNSDNFINITDYENSSIEIYHSKYYNGTYNIKSTNSINQIIIVDGNFIYPDYVKIKFLKNINYIKTETIQIYGNNLIIEREPLYFTNVQSYQHHSNIPNNIHNYSFCLQSEEYQPSGTLNFSVIDSKNLYLDFDNNILSQVIKNNDSFIIKIIARSQNLLVIEKGMGKIKFGI
jgi:hypothetical protein